MTCENGETNALTQRIKHATPAQCATEMASILAAANFANAQNRVDATFEMITLTGWAPADTHTYNHFALKRKGAAFCDALNVQVPLDVQR
jgi:hypothetical protein